MIRAVLHANVLASGLVGFRSLATPPVLLLHATLARRFTLVLSTPILDELNRTLRKPYFARRLTPQDTQQALFDLVQLASLTTLSVEVRGIATHPEDDLVLATALSAGAPYLVTGDKPLQSLGVYRDVSIVPPAHFAALLSVPPFPSA